jgi:hypothetical protein
MLFSCGCIAAFFWSKHLVPETRGRSLEEMDTLFDSAAGQEIAQRKREVRFKGSPRVLSAAHLMMILLLSSQIEISLGLTQLVESVLDGA